MSAGIGDVGASAYIDRNALRSYQRDELEAPAIVVSVPGVTAASAAVPMPLSRAVPSTLPLFGRTDALPRIAGFEGGVQSAGIAPEYGTIR